MAYSEFTTITKVETAFNFTVNEKSVLFADIELIEPSDYLKPTLTESDTCQTLILKLQRKGESKRV